MKAVDVVLQTMSTSAHALVKDVYMVHSAALSSREVSLRLLESALSRVSLRGILRRVVTDEPEDVTPRISTMVDIDPTHVNDPLYASFVKPLHVRQVSNAAKHINALQQVAAAAPEAGSPANVPRFSLVVEDDALFGNNVLEVLSNAVRDAPDDADIVFLGLPSTRPASADGRTTYDDALAMFSGILPACESYLVTPSAARKLVQQGGYMLPIRFPTNVQLSYAIRKSELKSYVAVPNVFVDGSKLGVFCSSLDSNNRLVWNQNYCMMEALARKKPLPPDAAERFDQLWAQQPFKQHPDVLAVRAAFLANQGRPKEAEAVYADALKLYDENNAIVNSTSSFLRAYMDLFRDLQD